MPTPRNPDSSHCDRAPRGSATDRAAFLLADQETEQSADRRGHGRILAAGLRPLQQRAGLGVSDNPGDKRSSAGWRELAADSGLPRELP
jgi:hypothetical protein